jgi:hypothetical protein
MGIKGINSRIGMEWEVFEWWGGCYCWGKGLEEKKEFVSRVRDEMDREKERNGCNEVNK